MVEEQSPSRDDLADDSVRDPELNNQQGALQRKEKLNYLHVATRQA
jgi:hypothetical protein